MPFLDLMFERTLAGKHHGHLRISVITGLYGGIVTHGTAGLENGGYALANADVGGISKRKKGV
jgi:hypothetical protein